MADFLQGCAMYSHLPYIWAKTDKSTVSRWHPLLLHMLDVSASTDGILSREPASTRKRISSILGLEWEEACPWLLLVIACHDLGKACPGFQCKWQNLSGLPLPRLPNTSVNHAFVSQIVLTDLLQDMGWSHELAELTADAVGCHHGQRASHITLSNLEGDRNALGPDAWRQICQELVQALCTVFKPAQPPTRSSLHGPDFMLLSGLTSFADWIGSNEDWFPFGMPEDCTDLVGWFQKRKACADRALDAIGWYPRTPLVSEQKTFQQVFSFSPRPLQETIVHALDSLKEPSIILVEAPMGEGKTEAAFFAHLELQRRFEYRGLYIALPTKATGNAMFHRTLTFLRNQGAGRTLDLQLLHGTALLNDSFQNLCFTGIHDPENGGDVRAGEWFTSKKRALLSEYGVGTVDQALITILPVRHNFVRLWGLANRVVVFDEIHAYDAYTGTLLEYLLRWLLALGSSVILLSATLSPAIRHNLARLVKRSLPEKEEAYPRLTVFSSSAVRQWHFSADPTRRLTVRLRSISHELTAVHSALTDELAERGSGLAIVNTVQRAQELYRLFSEGILLEYRGHKVGKRLSDGTEVFLFHARFPADWRQQREDFVLATFGKEGVRSCRKILIATQVAEQSLDLDFDVMVTDLAPIDLVLQRAGRLWRHPRNKAERGGVTEPTLLVAGLAGEKPSSFEKPLWWSTVYREDLLLLTWILLRERPSLTLPDEIDNLVQSVYENSVTVPDALQERLETAKMTEEGNYYAYRMQANSAIIGFPDDTSWNDPSRFVLYDEDQPGIHRTLMAQTRLGEESVVAIPLWAQDNFKPEISPDIETAKRWFGRAVRLSRTAIVNKLQIQGVPKGWQELPLLRNCFPLELDERGSWRADETVRLDDELGITFETKEKE